MYSTNYTECNGYSHGPHKHGGSNCGGGGCIKYTAGGCAGFVAGCEAYGYTAVVEKVIPLFGVGLHLWERTEATSLVSKLYYYKRTVQAAFLEHPVLAVEGAPIVLKQALPA